MSIYSLDDVASSTDRYKIYLLQITPEQLSKSIEYLQSFKIKSLNIGKEIAQFINSLSDRSFLDIDTYDFTKKLLDNNKAKNREIDNEILSIYNIGILFEPSLEINAATIFKDFSKSASLIIIWEYQLDQPNKLSWPTQKHSIVLDFSDIQLKQLQHAI